MSSRVEQVLLVVLALLVLSGAGFRLWMREGDIVIEVAESQPAPELQEVNAVSLSKSDDPAIDTKAPELSVTGNPALPKVNVNTASLEELESLPRIGPKLAQRIVEDRDLFGKYESVDDLERVKGIGSEILERIRPFVVAE